MMRIHLPSICAAAWILTPSPTAAQDTAPAPLTPLEVVRVERALEDRFACLGCHRIDGRGGVIGPALDGLSSRADHDYTLAMIRDPSGTVPGTVMPHQPMPVREAERLARYLLSLDAPEAGVPPSAPEPPPPLAPAHGDPTLMSGRPDDTLFDAIAAGGYVLDRSARMPAFAGLLSPAQIRALVGHIRVLCDCEQPAWAGDGGRSPDGAGGGR